MAAYRAQDFAAAREIARELEARAPAPVRGLYGFNARRFAALAAKAPPEGWEAVLALDEK